MILNLSSTAIFPSVITLFIFLFYFFREIIFYFRASNKNFIDKIFSANSGINTILKFNSFSTYDLNLANFVLMVSHQTRNQESHLRIQT